MNRILTTIFLAIIANYAAAQNKKVLVDTNGIYYDYEYKPIDNIVNEETGTKFTKYEFSTTIINRNSYPIKLNPEAFIDYDYQNVMIKYCKNESDKSFVNKNLKAPTLFHKQYGQIVYFDGFNQIQPMKTSIAKGWFVCPTDKEPIIRYSNFNIEPSDDAKGKRTFTNQSSNTNSANSNQTSNSNSTNDLTNTTISESKEFNFMTVSVGTKIVHTFKLKKEIKSFEGHSVPRGLFNPIIKVENKNVIVEIDTDSIAGQVSCIINIIYKDGKEDVLVLRGFCKLKD